MTSTRYWIEQVRELKAKDEGFDSWIDCWDNDPELGERILVEAIDFVDKITEETA